MCKKVWRAIFVLIETYWNVNIKYKMSNRGKIEGINRNILECK